MTPKFQGIINIDDRDSTPDWAPYLQPVAPEGAPNVLYIVLDDTLPRPGIRPGYDRRPRRSRVPSG